MDIARESYIQQTNYNNPYQNHEVKEKIKDSFIKKYGVNHPLKSDEIKEKRFNTYREKYNRDNVSQKHISLEILNILNNKEKLIEQLNNNSIVGLARKLKIDGKTIASIMIKYGIKLPGRSSYENQISKWLNDINIEFIQNTKAIISNELDFYIPKFNIAIEFCGLFFHSEWNPYGKKDSKYHYNKWKECNDKGIQLITIFEDEWLENENKVKQKLLSLFGMSEKGIPARKMHIKKVEWHVAKEFCDTYHLQNSGNPSTISYGAYDIYDNICGIMLFNRNTRSNADYELIRFVGDGKSHVGMASKLLKSFINDFNPTSIVSFADNRWSNGNLYEKIGFKLEKTLNPDYYYTDYKNRWHKSNFRKSRLKSRFKNVDLTLTEFEITQDLGYDRIWDCGKKRYIWKI
jgi:hypothetical protein